MNAKQINSITYVDLSALDCDPARQENKALDDLGKLHNKTVSHIENHRRKPKML